MVVCEVCGGGVTSKCWLDISNRVLVPATSSSTAGWAAPCPREEGGPARTFFANTFFQLPAAPPSGTGHERFPAHHRPTVQVQAHPGCLLPQLHGRILPGGQDVQIRPVCMCFFKASADAMAFELCFLLAIWNESFVLFMKICILF